MCPSGALLLEAKRELLIELSAFDETSELRETPRGCCVVLRN